MAGYSEQLKDPHLEMSGSVPRSPAEYPRYYRVTINHRMAIYLTLILSVSGIIAITLNGEAFEAAIAVLFILAIAFGGIIYFSTQFIIYEDRIIRENILGKRSIFREDIKFIEIRQLDDCKIAYIIPKYGQDEMALPAHSIAFDWRFHEWIISVIGNNADLLSEYRETYKP